MTRERYFRRAAWTLACLSLYPTVAALVAFTSGEIALGFPTGEIMGMLILLATAGSVGGALVIARVALFQPTFSRTLLVGVCPLIVAVVLSNWGRQRELAELVFWASLLASPVVLGAATFHGQDGRRWLRWGCPTLGAVLLSLLTRPFGWIPEFLMVSQGYLWLPALAVAVLGVVLYLAVPAKS